MVGAGLLTGAAVQAGVLLSSDLGGQRASAAVPSVAPGGSTYSGSPDLPVKTFAPGTEMVAAGEFAPFAPGGSDAGDPAKQTQNYATHETTEDSHGPLNVLVLGVDTRPGAGGEYMGTRSDTIAVVQVTPGTGKVEVLSIPRDLLVELWPGVQDRINTAYAYGGVGLSRDVVEGLTGIPIDYYAVVDFKGFKEVIDVMGGVQVDVEDEVPPRYGIQDGPQTLNGRQALFYARYRGTAGGDLDRIRHQQRLIGALREQVLSWNTFAKLPPIVGVLRSNVDTDVGPVRAISLARVLFSHGQGAGMDTVQLQGFPATLPNGDQVLVPDHPANERLLQDFRK